MIKNIFFKSRKKIALILLLWPLSALAWQHGIDVGYGIPASEIDAHYNTYGYYLDAMLYRFPKLDRSLIFTINTSLGHWLATTEDHNQVTTLALSGAFRGYFVPIDSAYALHPYLLFSAGPAYLSEEQFGENKQGKHVAFQVNFGGGSEIRIAQHDFDLNLRLVHFSNGGIFHPNEGYDVVYVLSVGYLF